MENVAPAWERGLKPLKAHEILFGHTVAPAWERGLKHFSVPSNGEAQIRRSRLGAWIETSLTLFTRSHLQGRSRLGAWIETVIGAGMQTLPFVAPAWERGLKLQGHLTIRHERVRSLPLGSVD